MDPLSLSASIIAVLQATSAIIIHLKEIHDAPQERIDFLSEISGLHDLLRALQGRVQEARKDDQWLSHLQALGVKDGPLDQFTSDLNRLTSKLGPSNRARGIARRLTWKFGKAEIKDILSKIERIKTICLFALTNDIFAMSRAIRDQTSEIKVLVEDIRAHQISEEHTKIADWLSPRNYRTVQNNFFHGREYGTGEWFLECEAFKEWCDTNPKTLWCPGMPGAGKTFLTAIVVDYLRRMFHNDDVAVACVYCNYKEQADQTAGHLFASLLKQVVQDTHVVSENIVSLYRRHGTRNTRPTLEELVTAMKSEVVGFLRVFIIIDALDECREDDGTRSTMLRALRSLSGTVNLMVTSRDLPSIAREFHGTKRLDVRANDGDLCSYIKGRINRSPRQHLRGLEADIVTRIIENAGGMFLLARLHMDSLVGKHNIAAVRRTLANLPNEVDGTYNEAMERIMQQPKDDRELARDILTWITYAYRPLSIKELQHALAVAPHMTDMDLECIIDHETLISVCAGLITIDEAMGLVYLVHYTTQQYFESKREILFPAAQIRIAETCLTYLSFDVFGKGCCRNAPELKSLLRDHPFLDYAARHWGKHIHEKAEGACKSIALRLLQNDAKTASASQVLMTSAGHIYHGYLQGIPSKFSGVHLSSFLGLDTIVKYHLENGTAADSKDNSGRTPLSYAAMQGRVAVVKLLLAQANVEADSHNRDGRTPLSYAAMYGRDDVVRLLMSRDDVDLDFQDADGRTPLSWASRCGEEGVMKLLIARNDVNVDSRDKDDRTPLSLASEEGHGNLVRMLLKRFDVKADSRNVTGRTPLSFAAERGKKEVVKLLITRNDVDAGSMDEGGRTPLSYAAMFGNADVMKLFLERDDVEVDLRDKQGRTPLSHAAESGVIDGVELLIARDDVEIDSKDKHGRTPLSWASQSWCGETVRLLVTQEDVEADSKDEQGRTPLSYAAENGVSEVVNLLVAQHSINADSKDAHGRTPLSWASQWGHEEVARRLLEREDIEADARDKHGRTPLSLASRMGHEEMVRLLISRGDVEIDVKDKNGRTPLSWACQWGHEEVVRLLMVRDEVDLNSRDKQGRTPLSFASRMGREGVVRLLLTREDLEVDLEDEKGRTPLSWACKMGREEIVQLLVEQGGVQVDSKDGSGRTPLSWASEWGRVEVVRLLIARDDVDVDSKDENGRTPLSWASEWGRIEVARFLVSQERVEVDSKDNTDWTPLQWASERGRERVVKFLIAAGASPIL